MLKPGYEAAKHLYQVGHRRIGFVGNLVPETVRHRWHGVSIFCREYGIELCWEWAAFGINLSTRSRTDEARLGIDSATRLADGSCLFER